LFVLASIELPMCILVCRPRWCPPLTGLSPWSDAKAATRHVRDFGWDFGKARGAVTRGAVTRRMPISLDTMVARTGGYAYDVGV
jgi:hypothetical protein